MIKKVLFMILFILVTNISAHALQISWIANPQEDQVIKYTVYYKETGIEKENKVDTPTNGVSLGDNEFTPSSTYEFSVSATNEFGESTKCEIVKYTIPLEPPDEDEIPDAPSGIKLTIEKPSVE